nr:MAG TPA: transcriptional regulator, crp family, TRANSCRIPTIONAL REGULATOR, CRP FAMILY.3A [Caudoviricetes sp.]
MQLKRKQCKQRLQWRNEKIRELFGELTNKYPQWRVDAVIEEVASRVYLSPRTVEAILTYEGIYAEN